MGCCVLATIIKQKCLAFLKLIFVLIYIPGDGKAFLPSMKVVTLKLAFEVLALICVWVAYFLFFITNYNMSASCAFAHVLRKLNFIHLGSPITKLSDPSDL